MTEESKALQSFGRMLMEDVRDKSIWHCDALVNGHLRGERAERIRKVLGQLTDQEYEKIRVLIPEFVDSVLHYALLLLEQSPKLRLESTEISVSGSTDLAAVSDGLSGELYGTNGWIAKFSKERKLP